MSLSSTQQPTVRGVVTPLAPERSASVPGGIQPDGGGVPPQLMRQQSLSGTGRVQAVRGELKPDLWKIAYKGIQRLMSQSTTVGVTVLVYLWVCTWWPYLNGRGQQMRVHSGVHTEGGPNWRGLVVSSLQGVLILCL